MNTKEQDLVNELKRSPSLKSFLEYLSHKEAKLESWKYAGDKAIQVLQGKAQILDEIKKELSNGR